MKYKITNVVKEPTRFVVSADFYDGDTKVGGINHAFPMTATEEDIEKAVEKSLNLFIAERERAIEEEKKKKIEAERDKVVEKLKNKEKEI